MTRQSTKRQNSQRGTRRPLDGEAKMQKLIINGGNPLRGSVRVSGGKNSSLATITAACLAKASLC